MSDTVKAIETHAQHSEESVLYNIDFTGNLAESETLTGSPSASISPSTDVTLGTPAINVATFVNNDGDTVAVGKGVTVRVSTLTAVTDYILKVKCSTTASNTYAVLCPIRCEA